MVRAVCAALPGRTAGLCPLHLHRVPVGDPEWAGNWAAAAGPGPWAGPGPHHCHAGEHQVRLASAFSRVLTWELGGQQGALGTLRILGALWIGVRAGDRLPAAYELCDLGQVTLPIRTFPPRKWEP